jgi:hypothetical protein
MVMLLSALMQDAFWLSRKYRCARTLDHSSPQQQNHNNSKRLLATKSIYLFSHLHHGKPSFIVTAAEILALSAPLVYT